MKMSSRFCASWPERGANKKGIVKAGDVNNRVGVEVIRQRGVDVEKLVKMLITNAGAEFASADYYWKPRALRTDRGPASTNWVASCPTT